MTDAPHTNHGDGDEPFRLRDSGTCWEVTTIERDDGTFEVAVLIDGHRPRVQVMTSRHDARFAHLWIADALAEEENNPTVNSRWPRILQKVRRWSSRAAPSMPEVPGFEAGRDS